MLLKLTKNNINYNYTVTYYLTQKISKASYNKKKYIYVRKYINVTLREEVIRITV